MSFSDRPPLTGVRILSAEQYGAGPFGSSYMAAMGAEIIKIEPPGIGDSSRRSGPHFLGDDDSQFFQTFNRSKKSITLNLKSEAGQRVLARLAATADGVMNNMRGDQPGRLGLTYDSLGKVNPGLVCMHLTGYGRTGSRAGHPAYDYLMQAEAGFMDLTGEPGQAPTRMGLSIVDFLSGITGVFAFVSALYGAARTGTGGDVDVTLYDVAMHQLSYPAAWYLNAGDVVTRRPRSGHPSVVPCEMLPTADGHIFVMCVLPKFWEALCDVFGLPELPTDPRFATPKARRQNRDTLMELLDGVARTRPTAEWMAAIAGRVPAAPVLTLPEALDAPFAAEAGAIETVAHPLAPGGLRFAAMPVRLDGDRPASTAAPALGADTDAVLGEAGFRPDEIAQLRAAGSI